MIKKKKKVAHSVFGGSILGYNWFFCSVDFREITVLCFFTDYTKHKLKYLLWKQMFGIVANLYELYWQKANSIPLETFPSYAGWNTKIFLLTDESCTIYLQHSNTVACLTHIKLTNGTFLFSTGEDSSSNEPWKKQTVWKGFQFR